MKIGDSRFFLGSDSAPHSQQNKESGAGSAGCYTSYACLELYAEAFDSVGKLLALPDFACKFGATFYGLPLASKINFLRLIKTTRQEGTLVPDSLPFGQDQLVPFRAGHRNIFTLVSGPVSHLSKI